MSGWTYTAGNDEWRDAEGHLRADPEDFAAEILGITYREANLNGGLFDPVNTRAGVQRHAEAIAARAGERL